MPLELQVSLPDARLSLHQGVKALVSLSNRGPAALALPGLYDTGRTLTFHILKEGRTTFRRLNGITSQIMTGTARIDEQPHPSSLAPGQIWQRLFDLSTLHYPLPAGLFHLLVTYDFEPLDIHLQSPLLPFEVEDAPAVAVTFRRDLAMLDRVTMLISTRNGPDARHFLRLCNRARPLADWFSEPILLGMTASPPFSAMANIARSDTFDPLFKHWIMWAEAGSVLAQAFYQGQPQGPARRAALPVGRVPLPWAYYDDRDELQFFCLAGQNVIEGHRFDGLGLTRMFECRLPNQDLHTSPLPAVLAGGIHLFQTGNGLHHHKVAADGRIIASQLLFSTSFPLHSWWYDSCQTTLKAVFKEPALRSTWYLVAANLRTNQTAHERMEPLALNGELTEVSFDWDKGVFHCLAATSSNQLYYFAKGSSPILVAEGEGLFFPHVVVSENVYLGCYRRHFGYRFLQLDSYHRGSAVVDFEDLV